MLERQDWKGAAQLQPLGTPFPPAEAITYFARAMGAARSGDFDAAQADIEKLKELRDGLEKANQSLLGRAGRGADPRRPGLAGAGQGNKDEALEVHGVPRRSRRRRARSTSRWRTACTRCASCSATC